MLKILIPLRKALHSMFSVILSTSVQWMKLLALALQKALPSYRNKRLFDQINQAYAEAPPDLIEQRQLQQIERQHRRLVQGEW